MSRRAFTSILTAATVALALPVYAQDKGSQGQRPNSSGSNSGSAVSRPSGGSGNSGGGSSTSSGTSSSRPSGGNSGDGSMGSNASSYRAAPSRPERRAETRAVPRSGATGSDDQRRVSPGGTSNASVSDDQSGRRRAVPTYSRPRDGRPVVGTAVDRGGRPVYGGGGSVYYNPYYRYSYYYNRYPYGYYWPGYGFGVGYFYDPWMWGSYAPYSFYDPYGAYGGFGGGYGGGYYGGGSYGRSSRNYDVGGVRLKVKPEQGQVYVDGYYVGEVDSFDGVFQKLTLEAGTHRVEIRAEGYLPEQFEVMVIPGETITYKGDLKRR